VLKPYPKLGLERGIFVRALFGVFGVIGGGLQMGNRESPLLRWAIATLSFAEIGGLRGYLSYDTVFGAQVRDSLIRAVWAVRRRRR
jgi:hypothetical protein